MALKLLSELVQKVIVNTSASILFPKAPILHFYPETHICPICGCELHVQKTITKTVVTMDIGAFNAKETVLFCPKHQKFFFSDQLHSLVPKGGTFGYDVIVEVGLALFVHCRNNREVMMSLAAKNVFVSEREISYLGRKFIIYLTLAHQNSQPYLRDLMTRRGGYILHVDGTCEGDSPNLFCGLDEITELVLDTIKIPSEKKEYLVPFFKRIKEQYGEPKALVHDMARGIIAAVERVFPGVPDFICHFHFLRDLGKDLLLDDYVKLQKRLRKIKVRPSLRLKAKYLEQKIDPDCQSINEIMVSLESGTWQTTSFKTIPLITAYALIQWVFEYPRQSNGYGFPFDRPYLDFYRRLQSAHRLLKEIRNIHLSGNFKDNRPFYKIYWATKMAVEDKQLNALAVNLEQKAEVFDKLRMAMRIALPENKNGINDNGDDADIKTIEEQVTAFRKWLVNDPQNKKNYVKMLEQIDKYWEKLFADPLPVQSSEGIINIQPQRTNNILERFFRSEKRRGRKKSGTASMGKVLKSLLAETPLVQNLKNAEYMKIVLDGCLNLAERFSNIDSHLVQQKMAEANNNSGKILPAIKKLIRDSEFTQKIALLFLSKSKISANCHLRS